jgi:hypothetical protein
MEITYNLKLKRLKAYKKLFLKLFKPFIKGNFELFETFKLVRIRVESL